MQRKILKVKNKQTKFVQLLYVTVHHTKHNKSRYDEVRNYNFVLIQ